MKFWQAPLAQEHEGVVAIPRHDSVVIPQTMPQRVKKSLPLGRKMIPPVTVGPLVQVRLTALPRRRSREKHDVGVPT